MSAPRPLILTPVFVEPTIKHTLLRETRYTGLVVLELIVAVLLLLIFFRTELGSVFSRAASAPDPLERFRKARLECAADGGLMIAGLGARPRPALAGDGRPIRPADCAAVLRSVNNGPLAVSLDDVLRGE
ncbi:subunit of the poxvirus multiprotein entry-fusion complex [Squirrelpox virus]|uniref:Subunit of the poxvirus multiprotein entry-fusion complex n=1 Tax=Squirrelpox virus TaxID=240426 RepID=U3UBI0_9POXV|nr:subunit of the poxvirus multiprotein entry-fusion complex [Squirrelpox virus]CCD83241.1 subunit of the poxvirus multiprotein entry-fusion complex [Squirrelpox virus]